MEQLNIFDIFSEQYKIRKPVRLIELFAGVGSQAMALKTLGVKFEHHRVVEFDKFAIQSYNAIHGTHFETIDIRDLNGIDLGIEDVKHFTYLLTYLQLSMSRFISCGQTKRHGKGKRYTVRSFVGSRTSAE